MKAIQERDPPRPSSLTPQIVRELELIVLKALAKEKSQRYQSMDAFAEDLRRHLAGETVLAHPPTAVYQFKKLVRRHKLAFSFSLVILLLIAAFAVTATVLGLRERSARKDSDWNAYIAGLAAASAALRADDATSAQRQLERTPARLRGWEWDYFSRQADGSLTSVEDGRNVVAVDHQGEPIAAVAQDQVWRSDGTERPCSAILQRDGSPGPDLSADLTLALVVMKENSTDPDWGRRLLDLRSGRTLAQRPWMGGRFSPDGRTLAVMEELNELQLIAIEGDIQTTATQPPVLRTDSVIHAVAFSRDSRLVACSAGDGTVQILDVATRRLLHSISPGERAVWAVAFSPDGMRLATGSWDKKVALWDLASQRRLWTAEGHRELISALAFSADGSRLASGSYDKTIGVWDAATGRPIARLIGHAVEPESLAFTDGNDRLASYDRGGTLKTWRILDHVPAIAQGEFRRIDFLALPSANLASGWLAVSESVDQSWHNPRVSLIDLRRRRKIGVLWTDDQQGPKFVDGGWLASAASPDGRWLAVGSSEGQVLLWRGDDLSKFVSGGGESMPSLPPYESLTVGDPEHRGRLSYSTPPVIGANDRPACWPTSLSFGANGRLALSRFDGGLEVWDIERRNKLLDHPSADGRTGACVLSPDGDRLAWADRDGGLHVLSVATGRILAVRPSEREAPIMPRFAFSPDGSLLVPLMHGADIVLYCTVDLSVAHRLRSHSSTVYGVAFSPDGTRLVSAANDSTLKIWDVGTGRELATLHGHQYMVNCVTFSADGKTLISGGADETVRFWDTAPLASP